MIRQRPSWQTSVKRHQKWNGIGHRALQPPVFQMKHCSRLLQRAIWPKMQHVVAARPFRAVPCAQTTVSLSKSTSAEDWQACGMM
jgi:hypothetical protein